MAADALAFLDDEGEEVVLDVADATSLLAITDGLEAATVSACPGCRSRVLACLALVAVLEAGAPHPSTRRLVELAEDAPTLHLYMEDLATECRHREWRDPGRTEWEEVLEELSEARPRH
jgi:hypothetical protein